ncbi:hypothetical protein IDM40_18720 [Nocardiopsis sp. HNM0947]|uniref:Secreted protein n=1 Tax=Nocardiopsis coralli TaxID=2772213 RepID=A0ABR9PA46_9ACTN|nr:hypothetical protein [Nocardiopsis coralli]MBE3000714.1 hypothetical protein [Nocardiopsis coralli]
MSTQQTPRQESVQGPRPTRTLVLGTAAALALALVPVSAGATESDAPSSADLEVLGSSEGTGEDTADMVAEVNEVSRHPSGGFVSVVYSISNNGTDGVHMGTTLDSDGDYSSSALAGVTLADQGGATRYHPLMNAETECICTVTHGNSAENRIDPNETYTYWALYKVPDEVESVDVEIPEFGEITDVAMG